MSYLLDTRNALEQAVRDLFPAMVPAQIIAEWLIQIDRESLAVPEIHIAPYQRVVTPVARGMNKRELKFVLMYAQPIGTDSNAAIEATQIVVETLEALLNLRIGGYTCTAIEQQMVVESGELTTHSASKNTILISLERASL